jgi:fibronectin type 3 domain-containing protein
MRTKPFFHATLLACLLCFASSLACGQNGPTQPSVMLAWTQSDSPGVTANCVYRGTASKTYALPALFCSATPIVTYTDTMVTRGTTYYYAVTAQFGKAESAYSNEVAALVPVMDPPTGNGSKQTKLILPKLSDEGLELEARVFRSK